MKSKIDKHTLQMLLAEAKENYNAAKKIFLKTDNLESMHEMENWEEIICWLETKIKKNLIESQSY